MYMCVCMRMLQILASLKTKELLAGNWRKKGSSPTLHKLVKHVQDFTR